MAAVVAALKPVLLTFITSAPVKALAVSLLRELAKLSDNTLDDAAVDFIEAKLKWFSESVLNNWIKEEGQLPLFYGHFIKIIIRTLRVPEPLLLLSNRDVTP